MLGELDGDGDLDAVVMTNGPSGSVWFNDGAGQFTRGPSLDGEATSTDLELADSDGDGDLDVVIASAAGIHIWLNDGHRHVCY